MKETDALHLIIGFIFGTAFGLFFGISVCQNLWIKDALAHGAGAYNGTNAQFELFQYPTNQ